MRNTLFSVRSTDLLFLFNFISNSPHGFDEFGILRSFVHFISESSYMYHNGVVTVKIFFAPYLFENLLGGNNLTCVLQKQTEYTEFGGCEGQLLAVKGAGTVKCIYHKPRYFYRTL